MWCTSPFTGKSGYYYFNRIIIMTRHPPYLQKGDTIGIVCPSGYLPKEDTDACVQQLQKWGFKVHLGSTVGKQYHSFSGTDAERCTDLQEMMDDASIKAILCGRGGYGMSRIIDQLDFKRFKKRPKWIIGFSDITVLHAHLYHQLHIASLHAPMARAFTQSNAAGITTLHQAITGKLTRLRSLPHELNRKGEAAGPLIGGNLSLIAHLIGSVSIPTTKGAILFLEDVGEYLYNIDRMMIQLKRSGLLAKLSGLVVGGFTEIKDAKIPFGSSAEQIIRSMVDEYDYPVCFGFPVSHDENNLALKHGVTHRLNVTARSVRLEEI
jgi:muramoyltetrapeptide carboxypeptidase